MTISRGKSVSLAMPNDNMLTLTVVGRTVDIELNAKLLTVLDDGEFEWFTQRLIEMKESML